MKKETGHVDVREFADTRSCNCCGKSNYKDSETIYEAGVYNYLSQGTCLALCKGCLYNLMVKAQEIIGDEVPE